MGALLVLAVPYTAPGEDIDCHKPTPELVQELTGWIADHTTYDTSGTINHPPEIQSCEVGQVIDYLTAPTLVEPSDRALYDISLRKIYLVEPWRATDPLDVATLLHELIHDVQFLNRTWECPNATEWEAYKLHAEWLEEQGIDPGLDWFAIYLLSRCPKDIDP